jgi:hypothetical protein
MSEDLMPAWHREALEAAGYTEIEWRYGDWYGRHVGAARATPLPKPNDWRETGRWLEELHGMQGPSVEIMAGDIDDVLPADMAGCVEIVIADPSRGPDMPPTGRYLGNWHEAVARAYVEAVRRGWIGVVKKS